MKAVNVHNQEVKRALPRLVLDISVIFVAAQFGIAALNALGHFIATHIKH